MFKERNNRVFVIAEISANHGQSYRRAVSLIRKAKECGADAVKFQTYTPDTITIDSNKGNFYIKHDKWGGQTLHNLYSEAYTPWHWFRKLKHIADEEGIIFFSSVFDVTAVDLMEEINVPCYKISSFELVDLPLIEYASKTKKPLLMSTGMASLSEIRAAVRAARTMGTPELVLLHCVSAYPAAPEHMHLKTIPDLAKRFKVTAGLSDHTLGIGASLAAVSLGARVVEKHFTLSRKIRTADNFFSIEPNELKALVDNVRLIEKALGTVNYSLSQDEQDNRKYRRSLFVVRDVKKGEVISDSAVKSIRPADGLEPKYLGKILGKRATKNIKKGTPMTWELVQNS